MTTKLMITAAALVIATGVASAQQYRADIPFAFHAGAKTLASGRYMVNVNIDQNYMVYLTDQETRHVTLLLTSARDYMPKSPTGGMAPVLTFACGSNRCSLAQIWTGPGSPALAFPQPRLGKDERASATEIRVVKVYGD